MYGSGGPTAGFDVFVSNKGVALHADDYSFYLAANGIVASSEIKVGSDMRMKKEIEYHIDPYEDFFMRLKPQPLNTDSKMMTSVILV